MFKYLCVIRNKERGCALRPLELVREQLYPSIVSEEYQFPVIPMQLANQTVLRQFR